MSLLQKFGVGYSDHLCEARYQDRKIAVRGAITMRANYDFSKSRRNPYAKMLKKQITIRLDESTIEYFKQMAAKSGLSYQNLINLYLSDCAQQHRKLRLDWAA